ncbi:MAG: bifunctional metallophosphatase/5'-nucleotidase [Myxococcaceae bacterium]|nr:bifunctional metallophosphatase/5'-nucleotidase [Myxococcaceae bacterium]
MRRSALLFFFLFACRTPHALAPAADDTPIHLTLIGTNDFHGWVEGQSEVFGDATLRFGGAATLASYVAIAREKNPGGVLLLDAGDLFQGTIASNITEGAVVIDMFNALQYDAAAIGNHEFDYGPVGPLPVPGDSSHDPFGALKARIAQAKFPLLSTNIYELDSRRRPAWLPGEGWTIVERKGLKIGLFGLTTPQTPVTTMPINVATLKFNALGPEAISAAKALREHGADVVVALVHAGGKCASWADPYDVSTCDLESGEVFQMLKEVPEGTVDAVIAGHTHQVMAHFIHGTPVVESAGLGRGFSMIELYVDPQKRKVMPEATRLVPTIGVCETVDEATGSCDPAVLRKREGVSLVPAKWQGQVIRPDPTLQKLLAPALKQVSDVQRRPLGVTVPKMVGRNYEAESGLGSLLADSLRTLEKADVVLLNPGGLRADLKPGELTYGAVYEVLPFDNAIATLTLNGDELMALLRAAYGGKKGVFQVSGLQVTLERCPGPGRLLGATLENGQAIDPAHMYRVVMPDFLARGGDGLMNTLKTIDPARVDLGGNRPLNFRDALVSYWQKGRAPLVSPALGRVSLKGDACHKEALGQ